MNELLPRVLLVDDDPDNLELLGRILASEGYAITTATDADEALELVRAQGADCIVSDVRMPGRDGFSLLDTLRAEHAGIPVILLTSHGGLDDAVRAVGRGAEHYLSRSVRGETLRETVRTALTRAAASRKSSPVIEVPREDVVGRSAAIVSLYNTIARVAGSSSPVLIRGETGVGKEWVARAIHRYGPRKGGPFVPVNGSALAEGTLESELFGHARGSFTGSVGARRGLFQAASGGVLFLDEVGELPPRAQAELLRVLQEGEVRPVGSDEVVRVDVRIVCATHRDLERRVADGVFREDLLFRLKVIEVPVPPLRERREDIPDLAAHFLARAQGGPAKRFAPETLAELTRRDWPGNVRELQSAVQRAAALAAGDVILPTDLPPVVRGDTVQSTTHDPAPFSLGALWSQLFAHGVPTLDDLELSFVRAVVEHLQGNKTQAAQSLGVDRKTIRRILARGGDDDE